LVPPGGTAAHGREQPASGHAPQQLALLFLPGRAADKGCSARSAKKQRGAQQARAVRSPPSPGRACSAAPTAAAGPSRAPPPQSSPCPRRRARDGAGRGCPAASAAQRARAARWRGRCSGAQRQAASCVRRAENRLRGALPRRAERHCSRAGAQASLRCASAVQAGLERA
jgi:hypothetical protein